MRIEGFLILYRIPCGERGSCEFEVVSSPMLKVPCVRR